jgi:CheY-like chemotaxis protein
MNKAERKRMLIVDDNEDDLIRLESLFETLGYDTTTAWSGQEALERLESKDFDVVLLDEFLPDVRSETVLRAIRRFTVQPWVALLHNNPGLERSAFSSLNPDCSIRKNGVGAVADALEQCLSHAGALALQNP